MKSEQVRWILMGLAASLLVVTGIVIMSSQQESPKTVVEPPKPEPVQPAGKKAPEPEELVAEEEPLMEPVLEPEPVPESVKPEPKPRHFSFALPELDNSDQTLLQQLQTKINQKALSLLMDDGLIERFVVTIDALSRGDITYKMLPIQRPQGSFKVIEAQEQLFPSTANIARYAPYLDLMAAMPVDYWRDFYLHTYPLMQQSYERLGYPDQKFHDVLLQALANLLEVESPSATVALVQPNVMYEYADTDFQQNATPVEKLLHRLGPDIHKKLKALLTGFKQSIEKESLF